MKSKDPIAAAYADMHLLITLDSKPRQTAELMCGATRPWHDLPSSTQARIAWHVTFTQGTSSKKKTN